MEKGKFIVFEGADGSGKSTQMRLLGQYLADRGVPCHCTCEPTGGPFGTLLRACMSGKLDADERAIALLFAADRVDHISAPVEGIRAKLDAGVTVLCDRYCFSSFAYNGGIVSLDWVIELNRPATELMPDLVIYLDLSPEESMRRVSRRSEQERYETPERQRLIREKYFEGFSRFPDVPLAVIKSEAEREATQANVRRAALPLFGGRI